MRNQTPFQAITYDYWNTLIKETTDSLNRRKSLWTELLLDAGYEVNQSQLDTAFSLGWQFFDRQWRSNTQTGLDEVVSVVIKALPIKISVSLHPLLRDAYLEASKSTARTLLPEVEETFKYLHESGTPVGVVCDVGTIPSPVLKQWLVDLGIFDLIDFFGFSDEIKVYKPDHRIFEKTLKGLGAKDPSRTAHIGDLKRTDVAGARSFGMVAIRYTGAREDDEEVEDGDYVSNSHLDILQFLNIL